ncbi:LLM class flavin-dependent oxidoreductase [Streptomyces sp. ISL-11]|uniref:LLM class flavin-dependent oxidoreductase n=1 Tax=Streptomyces sp. ISL-11 TaxID=2819174 RepID=UPI001BE86134|nr:LLM class flavin-dependent oxidoreductase [Streptomyces sp. ISL-11]MBT2386685.1 LLM class flavin-dependent oxidoreductase [Streptomyces sp. ISL-11]
MDVSLLYPTQVERPAQLLPFAQTAQRLGLSRLWTGQSLRVETHQVFSYLAGAGVRMPLGSAVSLFPLRHPIDAAVQARGVAAMTGHSYVAGFGPGGTGFQEGARGERFAKPVAATREFLDVTRRLLDNEPVVHEGEHYRFGFGLEPFDHPPVHLGAGVLRPGMARGIAGSIDVAITWMTPPEYVRDQIIPALAEGAAKAGRPTPRVATVVHAVLDGPGRNITEMALKVAAGHLSMAHYTDMLRRAGIDAHADDPESGAKAIVDAGLFVHGNPDAVAEQLDRHRECGISEIIINPGGTLVTSGFAAAIRDVTRIVEALQAL